MPTPDPADEMDSLFFFSGFIFLTGGSSSDC